MPADKGIRQSGVAEEHAADPVDIADLVPVRQNALKIFDFPENGVIRGGADAGFRVMQQIAQLVIAQAPERIRKSPRKIDRGVNSFLLHRDIVFLIPVIRQVHQADRLRDLMLPHDPGGVCEHGRFEVNVRYYKHLHQRIPLCL